MQEPIITFLKERLTKNAEHKHCCLCMYGRKAGIILWRVEFRGEFFGFHWLLCSRCRFLMFIAMGGRRIEGLASEDAPTWANKIVKKPKQKVADKSRVRTSDYFEMTWDRQKAVDHGIPLHAYEKDPGAFDLETGKVIKRKKKKKKRKSEHGRG